MKTTKIAAGIASLALSATLFACGGGASSYEQVTLDEADGIKVMAQNAGSDQSATTEGALDVGEGDGIVISPFTEKGSFHLTITSADGTDTVYDQDVEGRVLFMIDAKPGTYDVTTHGNDTTGWMTVFSQDKEEEAALDASLEEHLEQEGFDPSAVANK